MNVEVLHIEAIEVCPSKRCTICGMFRLHVSFYGDSRNRDGLRGSCKQCTIKANRVYGKVNREKSRKASKRWNKANPERVCESKWALHIKTQYGLSVSQYDALVVKQGNSCAICRQPETVRVNGNIRRLSIDHDHQTDAIRALLCSACNHGIGSFHDDPELLRAAADYLVKHRKKDQVR